ncbi:MAG: hypothetical protein LC802_23360 [Acidobacteria bacterium]|nr:hypothetical protein [Acidobacteriota bacterium]
MSPADTLARLRRFLLGFSVMLFGGTLFELFLIEHTDSLVQLIPFVLCGVGTLASLAALFRPRRATMLALRAGMGLIVLGSLFGIYEHVSNNFAIKREVDPGAETRALLLSALGGANPLLAPGMLAVASVLALAATYRNPALRTNSEAEGD